MKKSQISLFIVLGLIILFVGLIIYFFISYVNKEETFSNDGGALSVENLIAANSGIVNGSSMKGIFFLSFSFNFYSQHFLSLPLALTLFFQEKKFWQMCMA